MHRAIRAGCRGRSGWFHPTRVARGQAAHPRDLSGVAYGDFDVVVNATPVGTRGQLENATPATAEQLYGVRLAYDLVYNPTETQFMREALEAGCQTIGGLQMLIAQAVEQFKLWTGVESDAEVMRNAALNALEK